MQIPPRDQRRLLYRVVAVLIAMRAVSMFTVDLSATEAAAAHALGADGGAAPMLSRLAAAWFAVAGHVAGALRLPSLVADLGLVLLALAYARRNDWGTLTGLLTGFVLAMAPLGLEEGWRADGTPMLSLLVLGALLAARIGLKLGQLAPAVGSAVLVAIAMVISPVTAVFVPAGLYAALRSVTGAGPRYAVMGGWLIAVGVGLGVRVAVVGDPGPLASLPLSWLADPELNGAGTGLPAGPFDALLGVLAAVSAGGPTGAIAALIEQLPAPSWRLWSGLALWPLALIGLLRGQVMADPIVRPGGIASSEGGAGARDGWRALGVSAPTAPRLVGERDWMPLLLGVLGPAGWVAFATVRDDPAGIPEAIAVARPFAALLLGLGLTAVAGLRGAGAADPTAERKRFVGAMVAFTLLQFALGGHHVLQVTAAAERIAPHKIATFIRSEIGTSPVVGVGPTGLAVTYRLDPYRGLKNMRNVSAKPAAVSDAVAALLADKPRAIGLCGDFGALQQDAFDAAVEVGAGKGAGWLADRQLTAAGYELMEDGARYLGAFSVRLYARGGGSGSPAIQVKPQLGPGRAP